MKTNLVTLFPDVDWARTPELCNKLDLATVRLIQDELTTEELLTLTIELNKRTLAAPVGPPKV